MSLFHLLKQRRFGPFFGVQFLGALNDNLFKNTMAILFAYKAASEAEGGIITNLAAGLFILPFFLFSPVAGQLADKHDKARIMRLVKAAEIGMMGLGTVGFFLDSAPLLFGTLFCMGIRSAFFGPVKYSILPQHLEEKELMTGNALVEMGTFLAILLGTLGGGVLAKVKSAPLIAGAILTVAAAGYLLSLRIPPAPALAAGLKLNWNPFSQTLALTRILVQKPAVFNSILGVSWFWFFGATLLAQLLNLTKHMLQGNETVVTLLLAVFSLSVGVGSVLCAKLSRGEIELGLVPLGALGMTLFCADFILIPFPPPGIGLMGIPELFAGAWSGSAYRVLFDLSMIGISGSLFIVPLYALIQTRSDPEMRSRTIGANNVYNALFMVASALLTMVLYKLNFNTVQILLYTAILNLAVSAYIFLLIPEFVMRFVVWILASTIYRLRYAGRDKVPRQGPAVIVANHVSFIDWFVITAACRRPVQFVMDHRIFRNPLMGWAFKLSKAIPIAPAKEDAALKEQAFAAISASLKDGNLVCIFPEGKITYDGEMGPFKPGVERILAADPVPVVPIALKGLWGSFFSRKGGKAMAAVPRPSRRVIQVTVGGLLPAGATAKAMEETVRGLMGGGDGVARHAPEKVEGGSARAGSP